jgi:hypothetical protein
MNRFHACVDNNCGSLQEHHCGFGLRFSLVRAKQALLTIEVKKRSFLVRLFKCYSIPLYESFKSEKTSHFKSFELQ